MAYQLIYTQRARRDLRRLDADIKQRIRLTLEKYRDNPRLYVQKLTYPEFGSYRCRVGDYRVIFDITEEQLIVLRVGHRSEIYRGF